MSSETVAFIARTFESVRSTGREPRTLTLVIDLGDLPEGSNVIPASYTHHIGADALRDDPGMLGALIQSTERKADG